ncbi:CoA-binding protein [Methanoculleus chikugoensis]|uniref:CoA-binding protein n=1 Tax=Methanoculleus chikugoensis TaxID=118126 RepID=UPI001FB3E6CF|nr:CoA-binding protein [Methanoculleus chikugoensis]
MQGSSSGRPPGGAASRLSVRAPPPDIFYPESIAVIGASASPNKVGYSVLRNLLSFSGNLYPVNPRGASSSGEQPTPPPFWTSRARSTGRSSPCPPGSSRR